MRAESFKRGVVSILLVLGLVFSMISVASLASPGNLVHDPGGENIEVAQGDNFLIRHVLEWDEPENGAYTVTIAWDCYDNEPSENFTFVEASTYFTTGDYAGESIPAVVTLDSAPSPDYPGSTRHALSVECPVDSKDPRNGEFNVDITLRAAGVGGVPHIATDNHPIIYQFAGVIIVESSMQSWNRAPITIRVLGRGVSVSISPNYQSGPPGMTLSYSVTVTNTGALDDNYALSVSDNKDWGPTLDNYLLENVQPGENRIAALSVTIPENAILFVEDDITVTATSIEYAWVSDSASCVAASVPQEGFLEDFEGETWESLQQQGWKMAWDGSYTPNVSVENGQLYIDMHVGEEGRSTYVWRDASWTDFTASLNWNTIEYWQYSTARVILRASGLPYLGGGYQDIEDWQGIYFFMSGEYWQLSLRVDTNDDGIIEEYDLKADSTKPPYYASWHLVEATVSGANIKIWVGGVLWTDVMDERISLLPAGGIAIQNYEADTLVDNIVVNTGAAVFRGLENLYAVRLEKNLDLHQGSKLVAKFYTYSDAFENKSVIETFTPPWHVEENENIMHPAGKTVKKVRLDLTADNTENVISTIARFIVQKVTLEVRFTEIPLEWALAPTPEEKTAREMEFSDIPLNWALAPS
ncbi:MAG: hypothetical protein KAV43_05455 [Hadesarchaea archaeon]|nr:hypothetical protein [Hadesarchaea archaeon]